jgi:hypothetical protein
VWIRTLNERSIAQLFRFSGAADCRFTAKRIQALTGDPDFMTSLARGLAVVQAFQERKRHLTIAQISHRTEIPRAAVRRCLHTLIKLGYATTDGRTYSLLPKVLTLGHAYVSSTPLAVSAQPYLDRMSEQLHEACNMATLEGDVHRPFGNHPAPDFGGPVGGRALAGLLHVDGPHPAGGPGRHVAG